MLEGCIEGPQAGTGQAEAEASSKDQHANMVKSYDAGNMMVVNSTG